MSLGVNDGGPHVRYLQLGRSRVESTVAFLGLVVLSLALRIPEMDAMVNVDAYYLWSKRTIRFVQALQSWDWAGTYQSHHPGVILMWLVGAAWQLGGALTEPWSPFKLQLAVAPIAVIGSLFPGVSFLLTKRVLGSAHSSIAWLAGALLATEPLLVAHSQNAHLDMLVTGFGWSALLCTCIAHRERSVRWGIASGVLLGLALLTKVSAAGIALGIALVYLVSIGRSELANARLLRAFCATVVSATLVVFMLWPALWVAPIETLTRLRQGVNQEVKKTAEFMFLGRTGKQHPPAWIYALFMVYLVTPEFWIPTVLGGWWVRRLDARVRSFASTLLIGTSPLFILLASSKLVAGRYILPVMPLFGTLTACVATAFAARAMDATKTIGRHTLLWAGIAVVALRALRVAALHPLPITYCSSWTGVDCTSVFHVGWGEGLREAAQIIESQAAARGYLEPPKVYGGAYTGTMGVWTQVSSVRDFEQAQLLLDYLPSRLRRLEESRTIEQYVQGHGAAPLGEVVLQGRIYARVYPGPMY